MSELQAWSDPRGLDLSSTRTTQADPVRIGELTTQLGLAADDVEPMGWYKGKLAPGLEQQLLQRPLGKYVGVSAINPTPFGEGKTVVAIGLAMALSKLGPRALVTLREPSLAPVFGIKGGGAGGGRAELLPREDINLHFTGDLHAVTTATNLLAAVIDNHLKRGQSPRLDPSSITWRRAVDMCDKGLNQIVTGLGNVPQAPLRETGFDLTAASEVMGILALATGTADLRTRLGRIVVGQSLEGGLVYAENLHCAGAMAALLRDAIRPNLVQTCENTPALVHAGPFANISVGNCSVLADLAAIRLADYVVTESGFGADCGAEKFFNIKCRTSGLIPAAEILVCTIRALKMQSGQIPVRPGHPLPPELLRPNLQALQAGVANLQAHLEIIQRFGVPVVVAINRFPEDSDQELEFVRQVACDSGAAGAEVTSVFTEGSRGATDLARAVTRACDQPSSFRFLYPLDATPEDKIETIATRIYGAAGVEYEPQARKQLQRFSEMGFGNLPVCIAKTQYSLSHDPQRLGRPTGFRLPIGDVRLAAGAGYLYALAGEMTTMPGLPAEPAANRIDVTPDGEIIGIR